MTARLADLKKRLRPDRPMVPVTLRVPEDVIEDLKRIAPALGFSGYQPLMRAYIGQGLRADLQRLESLPELQALVEGLLRRGVTEDVINEAVMEAQSSRSNPASGSLETASTGRPRRTRTR